MRTKKIALNMICDIVPYLLIGIVGLIKVNYLIIITDIMYIVFEF